MSAVRLDDDAALVVIDVQRGFDDPMWGTRNEPGAEDRIRLLVDAWAGRTGPIVLVRHDSVQEGSPLAPGRPGNAFKTVLDGVAPDLLVTKRVNSAYHGAPDLDAWLRERAIRQIVIVGIQTNMCNETTARVGGNLGYDVLFVADAMHTFDLAGPDGRILTADELTRATLTSLHGGGFATVTTTADVLGAVGRPPSAGGQALR